MENNNGAKIIVHVDFRTFARSMEYAEKLSKEYGRHVSFPEAASRLLKIAASRWSGEEGWR